MNKKPHKIKGEEYSISEACERTGFSADTLRYYEKAGLLPGVERRSGRRVYSEANLAMIKLIDCMKKTGMPLENIAKFMRLTKRGESTVLKRLDMMKKQQAAVDKMISDLQACAEHIAFKVWYYETAAKEGLASLADLNANLKRYNEESGRNFSFDVNNIRSIP